MPAFTFEALDAQGQTRKGTLEADNARAARSQLRNQALVPLQVDPLPIAEIAKHRKQASQLVDKVGFDQ